MLKRFNQYNSVFIEFTKSIHGHGGSGWEFGSCLWSPSTNDVGADRYSIMREPATGDLVLHFYTDQWPDGILESRMCGWSIVETSYEETHEEPPLAGDWSGRDTYYRIDLTDYNDFSDPMPLHLITTEYEDAIRSDLVENRILFYPFTTYGDNIRTNQGIYLSRCTPNLYVILMQALGIHEAIFKTALPDEFLDTSIDPHAQYREARRYKSERYFFSRNPQLVADAKNYYGTDCQICGFNYEQFFGDLGADYIEVHHLNPLSEHSESEWDGELVNKLSDVAVLCANCHRMVHRKRPALSLDDVRASIIRTD